MLTGGSSNDWLVMHDQITRKRIEGSAKQQLLPLQTKWDWAQVSPSLSLTVILALSHSLSLCLSLSFSICLLLSHTLCLTLSLCLCLCLSLSLSVSLSVTLSLSFSFSLSFSLSHFGGAQGEISAQQQILEKQNEKIELLESGCFADIARQLIEEGRVDAALTRYVNEQNQQMAAREDQIRELSNVRTSFIEENKELNIANIAFMKKNEQLNNAKLLFSKENEELSNANISLMTEIEQLTNVNTLFVKKNQELDSANSAFSREFAELSSTNAWSVDELSRHRELAAAAEIAVQELTAQVLKLETAHHRNLAAREQTGPIVPTDALVSVCFDEAVAKAKDKELTIKDKELIICKDQIRELSNDQTSFIEENKELNSANVVFMKKNEELNKRIADLEKLNNPSSIDDSLVASLAEVRAELVKAEAANEQWSGYAEGLGVGKGLLEAEVEQLKALLASVSTAASSEAGAHHHWLSSSLSAVLIIY